MFFVGRGEAFLCMLSVLCGTAAATVAASTVAACAVVSALHLAAGAQHLFAAGFAWESKPCVPTWHKQCLNLHTSTPHAQSNKAGTTISSGPAATGVVPVSGTNVS